MKPIGLLHQRRPRPDRRRGGADRSAARAPHRRRRARRVPDRAAAARQPVLGSAERLHHAACRRLYRRIRRVHHAADHRQYAAIPRRAAKPRCRISCRGESGRLSRRSRLVPKSRKLLQNLLFRDHRTKGGNAPRRIAAGQWRTPMALAKLKLPIVLFGAAQLLKIAARRHPRLQSANQGARFRRPDHGPRRRHRALDRVQGRHDHVARGIA